jgi:hypothetical protein
MEAITATSPPTLAPTASPSVWVETPDDAAVILSVESPPFGLRVCDTVTNTGEGVVLLLPRPPANDGEGVALAGTTA